MKRILILGGGFLQIFVIKEAKRCGYYVLVLDANPNAEGFQYADEYAVIDIVDEESCLEYAKSKNIDGVLTAATDFSVLSMSRIATELGLPGINYESAKIIKNKFEVRRILLEAKADNTDCSYIINSIEDALNLVNKLSFPIIVKPVDGSGSRGVGRVERAEDFIAACELAMSGSITHRAMIEPFVYGEEYGVESFVNNGHIYVLGIMRKEMTRPPYYAELGHSIPSQLPDFMEEKIKESVRSAIKALGINHGSVNMDILVNGSDVFIVDVGARMGGNLIGSHLIPIGTGINYIENMIRAAVNDDCDFTPVNSASPVATKLLALSPGTIAELPDFEEICNNYGVSIEHHLHVGDEINEYHTNLDGMGYVIAKSPAVEEALSLASDVRNIVDQKIVRV